MIKELHLQHVGPAPRFDIEFAERLNILTGDNGLGKTFVLDVVWWAMTSTWAGAPAWPRRGAGIPMIDYQVTSTIRAGRRTSRFDAARQFWPWQGEGEDLPGLFIYVRADSAFSVSDDARNVRTSEETLIAPAPNMPATFHFTPDTLWNGLSVNGKVLCKGLLDDWLLWQYLPQHIDASQVPFDLLKQVLKQLSPHPGEIIEPGKPTRVSLEDVRNIPTIDLPYGNVAITHASAGMKRIISLAYLLVWAWYEHQQASSMRSHTPTDRLVLLIDEVESHLHPRWQRSIVPALLDVATALNPQMQTQIITTTHSPLVLASVEPYFNEARDRLFLFDLEEHNRVSLRELPWSKQGDTVNWLVSDVFGLRQARSKEAEAAIEAAEALMRSEAMTDYPEHLRTREQIHTELVRLLPGHDPFWPRWIVTAQAGVS